MTYLCIKTLFFLYLSKVYLKKKTCRARDSVTILNFVKPKGLSLFFFAAFSIKAEFTLGKRAYMENTLHFFHGTDGNRRDMVTIYMAIAAF